MTRHNFSGGKPPWLHNVPTARKADSAFNVMGCGVRQTAWLDAITEMDCASTVHLAVFAWLQSVVGPLRKDDSPFLPR